MGSSALEVLVSCAQAIQDGNLRLADSLVDQIWNLAAAEFDEQQSKVVKYFGEALLRRAHGLRHTTDNYYLTLQMTPRLYYHYLWYGFNELVKDAINNTVRRKKRLHIIDFYIPHLYGKDGYLFEGLPNRPGDPLSVRVSVLLPPFLQKNVDFQEEMEYLTEEAKRFKVELEDLKVVYAHNLGEVDATMLDFRRTEDEAVIVCYMYKLHTLLAEGGVMERELMKLKQINPEIVIIEEQDVNHNDSNFIKRLKESFKFYSRFFHLNCGDLMREFENYCRRDIGNIIECEGKDRIVRHQTLAQWRSLLLTGGFLPVPIQPESRLYTTNSSKIHEENGCLVINEENRPVFFISAWKLMVEEDHFNPINNNFVQAERSPLNAPNPMSSNGVLEIQGPHEQENGKQTSFESNANNENEILKADVNNFLISTAKRRKLKSNVWEEFIKNPKDGDGKEWAICAHCNRKFDGASKKGTTHLRKHLEINN